MTDMDRVMQGVIPYLMVDGADEAIAFYCDAMGFRLIEDSDLGDGKRWVVIGGEAGGALLLAKAKKLIELQAVGNQHGGRVGLFAHTDDFTATLDRLLAAGARFEEETRHEPYGTVAVFRDLYDNRWDLIESTAR